MLKIYKDINIINDKISQLKIIKNEDKNIIKNNTNKSITNKGTNAGGKNTNKHGLLFEKNTNLDDHYKIIKNNKYASEIKFINYNSTFIKSDKSNFYKYMKEKKYINENIEKAHGCKQPDECYINEDKKQIFIIEKKYQQCSGSVCEKIQSADFKLWQYKRTFPTFNVIYIYILSK